MRRRRWRRVERLGTTADVHVLPIADLRAHEETRACWCGPALLVERDADERIIVAHNAADGRELVEAHGVN